jgi:type IV pilus assembly protein PilF
MSLRSALLLTVGVLAGCVSSGQVDPMKTSAGREKARDAYISLGVGYLERGSTQKAKVPLKQALDIDSSSADAHAALALAFQLEMEPKLADEHYRRALSLRSNDARLLNNYGSFLFEQKRYDEALSRFQEAAEDNMYPERARVFENLGLTALKLDQVDQAREHFTRALRLNSRQPRALLEMALLSYDSKEFVPARSYYEGFSAMAEQNPRSLLLGSRLAAVFQDRDQAASLGLQLKRLYPGTPEYQQYLSEQ